MVIADQPYPNLEVLWHINDPSTLRCFVCGGEFGSNALVRTFRVFEENDKSIAGSGIITSPLGAKLVLYDRHFECLQRENVRYVTVSHVWNTEVAATQNKGIRTPQDAEVRRRVLEAPASIAQSISRGVDGVFEVWHDYISVPQWTPELKEGEGLGSCTVTLRLQRAGTVTKSVEFHTLSWEDLMLESARNLAPPTVEGFLDSFGSRHFVQTREKLVKSLSEHKGGYQKLERTVLALAKIKPGEPWEWAEEGESGGYPFWDVLDVLGLGGSSHFDYQTCGISSMVNAGLYVKEGDARGAAMCRIPGLWFERSLEDGICVLLATGGSGRIVGRAVWATPACACDALGELMTVQLPRLPLPKPREEFLRELGRI